MIFPSFLLQFFQLFQIIFGAMGVDSRILLALSDRDQISHMAVARKARRQMGNEIVFVADHIKMLPAKGDFGWYAAVKNTRAAVSKAL